MEINLISDFKKMTMFPDNFYLHIILIILIKEKYNVQY